MLSVNINFISSDSNLDYVPVTLKTKISVSQAGLSDCIGYWYWVYNILVYWVFLIHVAYFVIFPIQYKTIQYHKKVDPRRVKYMSERLNELKRKRKSIQRSKGEQKKWKW